MLDYIKKIFKKKTTPYIEVETTPLSEDQLRSVSFEQIKLHPLQYIVGSGQSTGLQRDHNEDAIFVMSSTLADGNSDVPVGVFIIADGMGGHLNGEIASGVAARMMARAILSRLYLKVLDPENEPMEESLQEVMEHGIHDAQRAVMRNAPGGGTTMTAALVIGEQVTIAHVGDSRAYFVYPDGRMQRVTKDHSLVQRMVELEEITEDEAKTHPHRNVLLRAIGQMEPYRPDIQTHQIPRQGRMLLCSDGLWSVVPENEIFRIVNGGSNLSMVCQSLVEAANNAGGPDNISVIVVEFAGF